MPLDAPEWYRRKSEECRQEAEHASHPPDKASWLKLAEDWLKLAQEVEGDKKEASTITNSGEEGQGSEKDQ